MHRIFNSVILYRSFCTTKSPYSNVNTRFFHRSNKSKTLFQQNTEASRARYFVRLDASNQHSQSTWVQRLTGSNKSLVQNLRQKVGDISATRLQDRSQELVTGRKLISLYALVGLTMKAGGHKIELEDDQFDHICQDIKVRCYDIKYPTNEVFFFKISEKNA